MAQANPNRTLTRLQSGVRAYTLLGLNLVSGITVYYGMVTGCGSSVYAELALLTYTSSMMVLLAYSFQAGIIEDCAIWLGRGSTRSDTPVARTHVHPLVGKAGRW